MGTIIWPDDLELYENREEAQKQLREERERRDTARTGLVQGDITARWRTGIRGARHNALAAADLSRVGSSIVASRCSCGGGVPYLVSQLTGRGT